MPGELERPDPRQLRISDADRHQVAEILREAAGEGRLDLDELDERLEATYAARTYADLVPITADLPAHPQRAAQLAPVPSADVVPGSKREQHFAIGSSGVEYALGAHWRASGVIAPQRATFPAVTPRITGCIICA